MALTIKKEKFARKYVECGNASEAYRYAYDAENMKAEVIRQKAYELTLDGDVTVMVNKLKAEIAETFNYTVKQAYDELEEARLIAKVKLEANHMISATVNKSRLFGLFDDKVTVKVDAVDQFLTSIGAKDPNVEN